MVSDYDQNISSNLEKAAIKVLKNSFSYKIIKAPGVLEIPIELLREEFRKVHWVFLKSVIKGKTPHFNYISKSTINALMDYSIKYDETNRKWFDNLLKYHSSKNIYGAKNGGRQRKRYMHMQLVRVLKKCLRK